MEKEIRDYCLSVILNSTIENWTIMSGYGSKEMYKNNIRVMMCSGKNYKHVFTAFIYTDSKFITQDREIGFEIGWCWNKQERKERKAIENKWDEIDSYFKNKSEYERAVRTYNLLPIKELRKKKLQNINESE